MTRTAAPAEVRKLSDLLEVSQTLGSTLNLKTALHRVLEILEQSHGTVSGSVILKDDGVKITISLSKRSIAFFKAHARKSRTSYQRMIRRVLDEYAGHHSAKGSRN